MAEFPKKSDLKIGMNVNIELKRDQRTKNLTSGVIKKILTSSEVHPHGIKVLLQSGDVGRVKQVLDPVSRSEDHKPSSVDASKAGDLVHGDIDVKIPQKEDVKNEFKSTFQYDLDLEKLQKNGRAKEIDNRKKGQKQIQEGIRKEIAIAVAAFANKDGGRLFVGVADDASVIGIGRDLKLFGDNIDRFTLTVTDSLKKFLQNITFVANLGIQFGQHEDKKYMVISVPSANDPVFVHGSHGQESYVRMQASSEKFEPEDFLRYCRDRFPK